MPASKVTARRSLKAVLALSLSLLGAASMLYYEFGLFMPRVERLAVTKNLAGGYSFGNDFYQVWLTSKEAGPGGLDLYGPAMTRNIQLGLYGRPIDPTVSSDPIDLRIFPYPAYTDLLLWPATQLSFPVVRDLILFLLAALTLASVLVWLRALSWHLEWQWIVVIFLLLSCSYPALEGLYAGQIGLLVACLLSVAILALQRGKLTLSGMFMALTTIKPQVTALTILYLVLWSLDDRRKRGRFCVGLLATMLLLVGAALVVWPHWIGSWTQVLIQYHNYTKPALVSTVLASLLPARAVAPAAIGLTAGFLGIASLLAWWNRAASADSPRFWLALSFSLTITTIALLPGQAVYDHVILLPCILLLARRRPRHQASPIMRTLMAIGAAMIVWPWVASLTLIGLRPFLSAEHFNSAAVLALPLRTAAALPFVVLGLLIPSMRGCIRDQLVAIRSADRFI